jgi:hypothetical protein
MFIIASAISPVTSRIVELPIDPIATWSLLLGALLAYGSLLLILGLVGSETKNPAARRRRSRPMP